MDKIDAAILSVFETYCEKAQGEISNETTIAELGIDSLSFMEIIMAIEEKLETSLSDDVIVKVLAAQKIGDLRGLFPA